jgi:2-oxo-3-hexenedioate decarboxylase
MLEPAQVAKLLGAAERDHTPIEAFSVASPDFGLDVARQAQQLGVQSRLEQGETLLGVRIGYTSAAKRAASGVDAPASGLLTSGMVQPYGEPLELGALIRPRAEPEIAVLLGAEVRAPASVTSVLAAIEAVLGAIDVIDSRYRDDRPTIADVVADNLSAGRVLLGPATLRPGDLDDLRLIGCVVRTGGAVAATAASAAALGHPAAAVAWFVNHVAPLPAGSLVLTGGLTAAYAIRPGQGVTAEFDGLGAIEAYG